GRRAAWVRTDVRTGDARTLGRGRLLTRRSRAGVQVRPHLPARFFYVLLIVLLGASVCWRRASRTGQLRRPSHEFGARTTSGPCLPRFSSSVSELVRPSNY